MTDTAVAEAPAPTAATTKPKPAPKAKKAKALKPEKIAKIKVHALKTKEGTWSVAKVGGASIKGGFKTRREARKYVRSENKTVKKYQLVRK